MTARELQMSVRKQLKSRIDEGEGTTLVLKGIPDPYAGGKDRS